MTISFFPHEYGIILQMKKLLEILFLVEDGEEVWLGLAGQVVQGRHKTVTVGMTNSEVDRVNRWVRSMSARLFHSPAQGVRGAGRDLLRDQGARAGRVRHAGRGRSDCHACA